MKNVQNNNRMLKYKGSKLSLTLVSFAVIGGILPLLFIPNILNVDNSIFILFSSVILLFIRFMNKTLKFVLLVMVFFLWGNWHGNNIKNNINFLSERYHYLDITVTSLSTENKEQKIKVKIDKVNNKIIYPPLYAIWKSKEIICAGQSWRINSKLKPLHNSLNESSFDQQRHQLAQRVVGTLKSKENTVLNPECSIRQKIINKFIEPINTLRNVGIIYGLMFGERTLLSEKHSHLLQQTGLTHLMAISGLHIGLAYYLGILIARGIQYVLPIRFMNQVFPIVLGLVLAFLYAWISGFAIPATRALFSLLLWIYIRNSPSLFFSWQWALWSIAGILLFNPLAILSDSFWLSSFAVLAILYWLTVFPLPAHLIQTKVIGKVIGLVHLQVGLLILLIPMQVIVFSGINVMSILANLWFVPLISWIVVPAILIIFLIPNITIQNLILGFIDRVIDFGLLPLPFFSRYWVDLFHIPYYLLFICWSIALICLFRWYKTYFSLISCIVVLILIERSNDKKPEYDWSMTLLDIGHGLAVIIEQNNLAYLYDTGNSWKGHSNAKRQIIPFLKQRNIVPIGIILSHNHLDHTGGVSDLIKEYPWLNLRSSFGIHLAKSKQKKSSKFKKMMNLPCVKGQKWQWGKLMFEVLWPETLSAISHNNDSCVIQFTDGYHKILLTGDIEKKGEEKLVETYKHNLHSSILFAPHHGSQTSSTNLLLRNVQPEMVLVSSARYSAWKIPSEKVYQRYKKNNIQWLNTAEKGQLTLWFNKEKVNIRSYRDEISPRWYHLWFGLPLFPE
ncbi:DNA internalization-related competence protein ComEC/Rec2 [Providencia vermicola]|uniref:DNA internalization-related competence protein ComEC/Rec2 n=1 Tax=Providencia vermicola TaxID=333965 RepID=UPI0032DA046F